MIKNLDKANLELHDKAHYSCSLIIMSGGHTFNPWKSSSTIKLLCEFDYSWIWVVFTISTNLKHYSLLLCPQNRKMDQTLYHLPRQDYSCLRRNCKSQYKYNAIKISLWKQPWLLRREEYVIWCWLFAQNLLMS